MMEIGERGVNGANAQRHANKENNQDHVNVIHQLLNMEGKLVWVNERRLESAMTMFLVQVSCASIEIIIVAPLEELFLKLCFSLLFLSLPAYSIFQC